MKNTALLWLIRHLWLLLLPTLTLAFVDSLVTIPPEAETVLSTGQGAGAISFVSSVRSTPQGFADRTQLALLEPHLLSQQGQTELAPIAPTCLLDPKCLLQNVITSLAQQIAQGILTFLQPIVARLNHGSLNFLTQTPVDGTYNNGFVKTFVAFSLGIVDTALATLLVIGGYTIMIGRQIGARSPEMMELLPRIALAVLAAHMSLTFVQWFIDLENALSAGVTTLAALTILTNTLVSLFTTRLLATGWLLFVLVLVLVIMDFLVAWQMLLRLAFLAFLIALAPLGFLCFALPQTHAWGRLWLTNFVTTVFVQFFQVAILSLGGVLLSALLTGTGDLHTLFSLDTDPGQPLLTALMSSAVFFLVLKIPGMLRQWALSSTSHQAGRASLDVTQGMVRSAANVGGRLLALL